MASATKYTNIYASYGAYYGLYVEFVENSTSVANNTSSITLSASISSQNRSGWSAGSNSTLTLYWHDNRENRDVLVASATVSKAGMSYGTASVSGTFNPANHARSEYLRLVLHERNSYQCSKHDFQNTSVNILLLHRVICVE